MNDQVITLDMFVSILPPPSKIYSLSLHDALPISLRFERSSVPRSSEETDRPDSLRGTRQDRKSTRLNSSHQITSYAVLCLKKKTTPDQLEHKVEYLLEQLDAREKEVTRLRRELVT